MTYRNYDPPDPGPDGPDCPQKDCDGFGECLDQFNGDALYRCCECEHSWVIGDTAQTDARDDALVHVQEDPGPGKAKNEESRK